MSRSSASSSRYSVQLEVAGPVAMFARPDTGATPTSYPAPTWSAAKGIFESIAFFSDGAAFFCPTRVEICRMVGAQGGEVQYQRYAHNYGGWLRKPGLMNRGLLSGGSSMQLFATILSNVIYRIYADVLGPPRSGPVNARHHLQDVFNRRVKRGQCFRLPRLGWSECVCSYWGSFREGVTEIDTALNLDVPSMLASMWAAPVGVAADGAIYDPSFVQGATITQGVLRYAVPRDWFPTRASGGVAHAQ